MPDMKFEWGWCKLCQRPFVKCPKCGNNTCNGGYGKNCNGDCDVCPLAYQYHDLAAAAGKEPSKEECIHTAGEDKSILEGLEKVEF
jgi:hypothetical protein